MGGPLALRLSHRVHELNQLLNAHLLVWNWFLCVAGTLTHKIAFRAKRLQVEVLLSHVENSLPADAVALNRLRGCQLEFIRLGVSAGSSRLHEHGLGDDGTLLGLFLDREFQLTVFHRH